MNIHEIRNATREMLAVASENTHYGIFEADKSPRVQLLGHIDLLMNMQDSLTDQLREATAAARAEGASWAELGGRLGMTRQAAQQKYGKKNKDEQPYPGSDQLIFPEEKAAPVPTHAPNGQPIYLPSIGDTAEAREAAEALEALRAVDALKAAEEKRQAKAEARKLEDEQLREAAAASVARIMAEKQKPGFKGPARFKYKKPKGGRVMSYEVYNAETGTMLGLVYRDTGTTWAATTMHGVQTMEGYPGSRDVAAASLTKSQ